MTSQLSAYLPDLDQLRSLDGKQTSMAIIAAAGTIAALSTAWVVRDYNQWIEFGTGGTPPTPSGYWRMTKIRWWSYWSKDDMRDTSKLSDDGPKFLHKELPQRRGDRPRIMSRTMPQRQIPDPLDAVVKERLHALPAKFSREHPDVLILDKSKTEGGSTDAIYAKPDLPGRHPSAKNRILGNEFLHAHPAENSLHVWLSPPDAKAVVEKGWGERFPLSAMGLTHPSFIFVYAPRSMEEVDVVEDIVKAAIAYLTGKSV